MKYLITESQYNKAFDKVISYVFENHREERFNELPESIFWVRDEKIIAEIRNLEIFIISEDKWNFIKNFTSSNGRKVESILKKWLNIHYGLKNTIPVIIPDWHLETWSSIETKYLKKL